MKKICVMILVFIAFSLVLAVQTVKADQQGQIYSKIYLNPFYRESMTKNINYTYNLTLNPPDKIGSVISAMVSFQLFVTSSPQRIDFWANGKRCNNPSWSGTSSGFAIASFDCSNIITQSGLYNFTIFSDKDVGSSVGFLEITYTNKPIGQIKMSGTEYSQGDLATIFVQVIDEQGLPVGQASCFVDIWYPSSPNLTHPYTIHDAPMLKAVGDDGIYYYDFNIPSLLGVYMLSSKCSYATSQAFVYSLSGDETFFPNRTVTAGTFAGSPFFLTDYEDWIYQECSSTGGATKTCDSYYDFNTTIHFSNLTNVTYMSLFYMGESSVTSLMTYYVWNWTNGSWITLPNTLTFSGTATTAPIGISDFQSNTLPLTNIINSTTGMIRIRMLNTFGSSFSEFDNWLNIQIATAQGMVQEIKGSGEMHVTSVANKQLYTITTLCGSKYANSPVGRAGSSSCALINNTDLYGFPEGDLDDYINITGSVNQAGSYWTYQTPTAVSCQGVYWVKFLNTTSNQWQDVNTSAGLNSNIIMTTPIAANCQLDIPIDLVSSQTTRYWIKMDNYMRYKMVQYKNQLDYVNNTNGVFCDPLATLNNYNYTVPILATTNISTNFQLQTCHYLKDVEYWAYTFWNQSFTSIDAGDLVGYYQEFETFASVQLRQQYQFLLGYLINTSLTNIISINGTLYQVLVLTNQTNFTVNAINTNLNTNMTNIFNNFTAIQNWESRYFLYWNGTVFINYNNNFTDINNKLVGHTNQLNSILANLTFVLNNQSYQNSFLIYWNGTLYQYWNNNFTVINQKLDTQQINFSQVLENLSLILSNSSSSNLYLTYFNNTLFVAWNNNFTAINQKLDAIILSQNVNYTNIFNNFTAIQNWENRYFVYWNQTLQVSIPNNFTNIQQFLAVMNSTMPYFVWNFNNRVLTDYNLSGVMNNLTEIRGIVIDANQTIYVVRSFVTEINGTVNDINNTMPSRIWSFTTRTLTDYNMSESFLILTQINGTVIDINTTIHGLHNLSAQEIWTYMNRELTNSNNSEVIGLIRGLSNLTATEVWTFSNRSLTSYNLSEIQGLLQGMSNLTAQQVWDFNSRNLTFFDYETQSLYVWNATSRTLTFYNTTVNNITTADIWSFPVRDLTNYNQSGIYLFLADINTTLWDIKGIVLGQANLTASQVWSFNSRTLTDYNNSQIYMYVVAINDTVYENRGLIRGLSNLTSAQVWSYVSRTLTDYNLSEIKGYVVTINDTVYVNKLLLGNLTENLTTQIWSFTQRSLTDYNNSQTFIYLVDINATMHDSIGILNGLSNLTAQQVWTYVNRSLTDYNNSEIVGLLKGMSNLTAEQVWAFNNRTLTDYNQSEIVGILLGQSNLTASQIWSFSNRSLTEYNLSEIAGLLKGMSNLTAQDVWLYSNRSLTFFDYETQALYVWNSTTRTLTFYNSTNLTAGEIWSYTTRTLTDYNQSDVLAYLNDINLTTKEIVGIVLGQANLTAAQVWTYSTRTLTDYNTTQLYLYVVDINDTVYENRNLIRGLANLTAEQVWNYTTRTLTFYNTTSTDLTSINDTVTQILGVLLGQANLTAQQVWTYSNRTLTDYNNSQIYLYVVDINSTVYENKGLLQGMSNLTAKQVWEYLNRTLTDYNLSEIKGYAIDINGTVYTNQAILLGQANLTAQQVWSYINRTLTDYNLSEIRAFLIDINGTIYSNNNLLINLPNATWNYTVRTLTDYNLTEIREFLVSINGTVFENKGILLGSSNLTAQQVWNYVNRTLSDYNSSQIFGYIVDINDTVYINKNLLFNLTFNATTPSAIWSFSSRTLTDYNLSEIKSIIIEINGTTYENKGILLGLSNLTAGQVWNYTVRELTDYNNSVIHGFVIDINGTVYENNGLIKGMANLTADQVWSYSNRTLTFYNTSGINFSNIEANLSEIRGFVIDINGTVYTNKGILLGLSNLTADQVWSFASRVLTDYNLSEMKGYVLGINDTTFEIKGILLGQSNLTAGQVWAYTNRTLSDYNLSGIYIILSDINVTIGQGFYNLSNLTAQSVWIYSNRILTEYNNTEIIGLINGLSNLSAANVWTFGNRSLTEYNNTEIIGLLNGLSNITASDVWNFSVRSLTDYNNTEIIGILKGMANITGEDVWNFPNRSLTVFDYQTQALYIWNSTQRTLTYYNTTFVNVTAADIWSFSYRTLTDLNGTQVTIYTANTNTVVNNLWNYLFRTNQSVLLSENITNLILNETSSLTINYSIFIPLKAGFNDTNYLPVRINYWFLDSNGNCIDQFNESTNSTPHCQPLEVETVGKMLTNISFIVKLRPQVPVGTYSVIREIQIDPNEVWISYGTEPIGRVVATQENTVPSAIIDPMASYYPVNVINIIMLILVGSSAFGCIYLFKNDSKKPIMVVLLVFVTIFLMIPVHSADLITTNFTVEFIPLPPPPIIFTASVGNIQYLTNEQGFVSGHLYQSNGTYYDNATIRIRWYAPNVTNSSILFLANETNTTVNGTGYFFMYLPFADYFNIGHWQINVTDLNITNSTINLNFTLGLFVAAPPSGGGVTGGVILTGGGGGLNICGDGVCTPGEEQICLIDCGNVTWYFTPDHRIIQLDKAQCFTYDFLVGNTKANDLELGLVLVDLGDHSATWTRFNGTSTTFFMVVPGGSTEYNRKAFFNVTTCVPDGTVYKRYSFNILTKSQNWAKIIPIDVEVTNIPAVPIIVQAFADFMTSPFVFKDSPSAIVRAFSTPLLWIIIVLIIITIWLIRRASKKRRRKNG